MTEANNTFLKYQETEARIKQLETTLKEVKIELNKLHKTRSQLKEAQGLKHLVDFLTEIDRMDDQTKGAVINSLIATLDQRSLINLKLVMTSHSGYAYTASLISTLTGEAILTESVIST